MKRPEGFRKVDKIGANTFAFVIRAYVASPKFAALAASTKIGYLQYLKVAEHPDVLGKVPVGVIRPALVQEFLDGLSDRPGAQIRARVALKAVEKWALVRDLMPFPIMTGTEVVGGGDGHRPWTDAQVAAAEQHCRPDVARAITLAANTGQRGSDLVRMRWSDIEIVDGHPGINVDKTMKTGRKLWVPFTSALAAAVATWERRPTPILLRPDGQPWKDRRQLHRAWEHERNTKPMLWVCSGLVLHGLRATAVVRLRRAGAPATQISDMIGLSVAMVERYCRFADQKQSAMAAVHYLNKADGSPKAESPIKTNVQSIDGAKK